LRNNGKGGEFDQGVATAAQRDALGDVDIV
jgi:hypothetical protein